MTYSIDDVARMLGVTRRTIMTYLYDGKIECSMRLPGGRYRFTEDDNLKIKESMKDENRKTD
jgi:excisionase family DNA binding protein